MTDKSPQHFIYPLNPKSRVGYTFQTTKGSTFPTNYAGFVAALAEDDRSEWGLVTGFTLVRPNDMVWVYFAKPDGNIRAVGRARDFPHYRSDWGRHAIWIEWDSALNAQLERSPIPFQRFGQRVQGAVCTANRKTQTVLDQWLTSHRSVRVANRDQAVSFAIRETTERLGQPAFRSELMGAYAGRCAISRCDVVEVLEAAHLQAVANGGPHSVRNGLLLRSDLHSLLDRGLLTITDRFTVAVHPSIRNSDYGRFHGARLRLPASTSLRPTLRAIRYHRNLWDAS